jgi:hypothetical protein
VSPARSRYPRASPAPDMYSSPIGICMPSRAGRSDPDFPKALTKPLRLKPYRLHVTTSFVFPPIRRNVP